jgi:hypothetical protein
MGARYGIIPTSTRSQNESEIGGHAKIRTWLLRFAGGCISILPHGHWRYRQDLHLKSLRLAVGVR